MKFAIAFTLTLASVAIFVATAGAPLAMIAMVVAAVTMAAIGLADDDELLAPYRHPGGDR